MKGPYSWSWGDDGGPDCLTELSKGGELSPINNMQSEDNTKGNSVETDKTRFIWQGGGVRGWLTMGPWHSFFFFFF